MKGATLFAIFAVALVTVLAIPTESRTFSIQNGNPTRKAIEQKIRLAEFSTALKETNAMITPKDWLSDMIFYILGVEVGTLLSSINTSLVNLKTLITNSVIRLNEIKKNLDPDTQNEIQELINESLKRSGQTVTPILESLGLVLPMISNKVSAKEAASDLIQAILGISLEQLLKNIVIALEDLDKLLASTMRSIKIIAESVNNLDVALDLNKASEEYLNNGRAVIGPVLESLYKVLPSRVQPRAKGLVPDVMSAVLKFDVREAANKFQVTWDRDLQRILKESVRQLESIILNYKVIEEIKVVIKEAVRSVSYTIEPLVHVFLQFASENGNELKFEKELHDDIINSLLGVSLEDFLNYVDFAVNTTQVIVKESTQKMIQIASIGRPLSLTPFIKWTDETVEDLNNAIQPFMKIVKPILPPINSQRKWVSNQKFLIYRDEGDTFCNFSLQSGYNKDLIIKLISAIFGFDIHAATEALINSLDNVHDMLLQEAKTLYVILEHANSEPWLIKKVNEIIENALNKTQDAIQPGLDVFLLFVPNTRHDKDVIADIIKTFSVVSLNNFVLYVHYTVNQIDEIIKETIQDIHKIIASEKSEILPMIDTVMYETINSGESIMRPFLEIIKPIIYEVKN